MSVEPHFATYWKTLLEECLRVEAETWVLETLDNLNSRVAAGPETPIEQMMLTAMFVELGFTQVEKPRFYLSPRAKPITIEDIIWNVDFLADQTAVLDHDSVLGIGSQVIIDQYRVDFVVAVKCVGATPTPPLMIVVECDGHDFHERTKEQAMKDRSRDRDLQAKGFMVLRFTGSEIYRRANICAQEILEITDNWVREVFAKEVPSNG